LEQRKHGPVANRHAEPELGLDRVLYDDLASHVDINDIGACDRLYIIIGLFSSDIDLYDAVDIVYLDNVCLIVIHN
jgi:hypothetical protein